jgi:hypothetical protein
VSDRGAMLRRTVVLLVVSTLIVVLALVTGVTERGGPGEEHAPTNDAPHGAVPDSIWPDQPLAHLTARGERRT